MYSPWMLFLWVVLGLCVIAMVSVAIATFLRIRNKVGAQREDASGDKVSPDEDPGKQ